jgi:hypothetical protein
MTEAPTTKRPYRRSGGPHRNRAVSLPDAYWTWLRNQGDRECETINRMIRNAIEAKYPEIKQAKEIGQ